MGALPVVMNAAAGSVDDGGAQRRAIEEAFAAAGSEATVHLVEPDDLAGVLGRLAEEHEVVVVAGGDGTLGTAAAAISKAGATLGVLPLGTFNHFAKDLGIPVDDLPAAAAVVVSGDTVAVDLAEVNGCPFVNNSSIGMYPAMVDLRDEIRESRSWGKVRSVPVAAWRVLRRFPVRRLRIRGEGFDRHLRSPFVFVGNNRYETAVSGLGSRLSIQDGVLSVYVAEASSRWQLVRMAVSTLARGAERSPQLDNRETAEVEISAHGHRVLVAVDGEVTELRSPLRYRVHAGALQVRVPAESEPPVGPPKGPAADAGVSEDAED